MTQTLLYLALHCVGASVALAFVPRRYLHLGCALGFSIGLALFVAVVLFLATTGIPYTVVSTSAIAAIVLGVSWWRIVRRGVDRAFVRTVAIWAGAFAVVSLPLTHVNLSFLTYDSHTMVMLGGAISDDHGFAPGMIEQLSDWGVFTVIAQSGVGFTRESYLYSLASVLGASTIPVFALTLWYALEKLGVRRSRSRVILTVLLTATTFTSYMFLRHFFYIHTNLGSAVYMFEFIALFWLAEISDEPDLVPVAFIAMLALALHRIEHPIICAMFLSMTVLQSKLPRRMVLGALGVYTLAVAAWFVVLATRVSPKSEFLTPTKCFVQVAVVVVFFGYAWLSLTMKLKLVDKLNRALPMLAAAVIALGLIFAFATKYEHMKISFDPLQFNLLRSDAWVGVWPLILGIAIVGLFAPAPPARAVFVWGIPVYFFLIMLLAYGRTPYRISNGDSGTRMAMHLIPITLFYFGVKFIPLLLQDDEPEPS